MSGELLSNVNTPFGVIEGFCLGRACRRMRTAFLCVDVSGCLCKNTEKSGKQFAGKEKGVKKKSSGSTRSIITVIRTPTHSLRAPSTVTHSGSGGIKSVCCPGPEPSGR